MLKIVKGYKGEDVVRSESAAELSGVIVKQMDSWCASKSLAV